MNHNKKALTLTIIIPAFNEETLISRCLDSISNQSVMPTEVLVMDNNSYDDTVAIASQYPFVKVIPVKKQGIIYARDIGFVSASSDIIARIDADSVLRKDWVETILKFYSSENTKDVVVTGGTSFINLPFSQLSYAAHSLLYFKLNMLFLGFNNVFGSSFAFHRSVMDEILDQTCTNGDYHEDIDLSLHLHESGYKVTVLKKMRVGTTLRGPIKQSHSAVDRYTIWKETLADHGYSNPRIYMYIGPFLLMNMVVSALDKKLSVAIDSISS